MSPNVNVTIPNNDKLPKGLLTNTAGLFISGDPGSGKTVCSRELIRWAAKHPNVTVIYIDPEGDGAEDCERDLSEMPKRIRDNSFCFFPADTTRPIAAINPLAVDRSLCRTKTEYEAQIECRSMLTTHLFLDSVTRQNTDGVPPRTLRWGSNFNRSLAKMCMTVPDGKMFFDVGSPTYDALTAAIPDDMARLDFDRLAELKISAQDEQLESIKNRYVALISNPILEAHLSTVEHYLPFRQLIRQNANLYFNLSQGNETLSVEAQNVLANIILSEVFHILFTTPRSERTTVLIVCDELPVFHSSAPLITRFLRRGRKLGARFVGLAQGVESFPQDLKNPLLNAMVSSCNCALFRHSNPLSADFFGRLVSLPTRRADRVKFEHEEERQVHVRNEIITLVNRSITHAYSHNEGEAGSSGASGGQHEDHSETDTDTEQATHTDSREKSKSMGKSKTNTEGEQDSQGSGESLDQVGQLYGQARHEVSGKNKSTADTLASELPFATFTCTVSSFMQFQFPDARKGLTRKFICGPDVYLTVNPLPNGEPGEIFVKLAKQGSTLSGLMQAWAVTISAALQRGVPWSDLRDKYRAARFEPNNHRYTSLVDAVARNVDEMIAELRQQHEKYQLMFDFDQPSSNQDV